MSLADVLDRAADGGRITYDEGVRLYREASLHDLGAAAHARRMALYPTNDVTYVIDTTINYTNVCNVHCTFCAFFRPEQHGEGYTMSHDRVLERVKYAADQGATQIMIQGGVNPELRITWFEELFRRVALEFPNVDIHSLSVSEISGLAKVEGMTPREVLVRLKDAGLKSVPGAGAEILVERVRKRISARKIVPEAWIGIMREAQLLGMPTTATMMFGSIETDEERIAHLQVIRDLQDETGGFTAFIPWYYVPYKTPLRGREASGLEYLRVLAVSRLFLDNLPHLQASWLTPGLKLGQLALFYGCDDMGGTILEEQVVHDAGGGNEATRAQLEQIVRGAGFTPVIRDTYWNLRTDLALATA
ncbi:MAG TPA: cyclic dehypoxanthinyl futalosine synthase [Candidatus Limnocylindria bacterium]|nr:cyclic dehypoxanthinyl futalosine synthase [Candidatus Limnocylindria bacterium]